MRRFYAIILFFCAVSIASAQKTFILENLTPPEISMDGHELKFSSAEMYIIIEADTVHLNKVNEYTFILNDTCLTRNTNDQIEIIVLTEKKIFSATASVDRIITKSSFNLYVFHFMLRFRKQWNMTIIYLETGLSEPVYCFAKRNKGQFLK